MNKAIIKEAVKSGITLYGNHFVYNSTKVDVNRFLYEVSKLKFCHSIPLCVEICKKELFNKNKASN